jgi:chitodextrinase
LFDTAIVDTTPPSTPTNLRANYVRGNNVSLSWTGSTDAGTEVTYIVYRDGVRIGSTHDFTNPALLPLYHDWEVSPETTYTYKVTAVDEYGNFSTASNEITVTTPVLDTTPPTAPGFLHTTKITPNSYEVQWTASTDNIAVEKYRIEQNDVTYLFLPPTSTTFTNSYNVSPSTSYTVRVTAIDTSGNTAMSSITFTTPAIDNPPTAPTNLRIVSSTANSVTLQWDASTDDGRVEGYQLYRNGTARGGVYAPNLQIADSIVTPGQTYTYEVAAWDNASPTKNYSPKSNKVTVTIPSNGASPTNPTYTHPAYSPAMLQNENGETKAVAVGLDNGLYFYSNIKGSSVWEMQRISGPGTAFSTPVMLQRDSGEINIVVLGPGNTLFYYFNFQGDTTWGKLPVTPPGRAMSGASMLQRSDGETDVVVRGPNNSLRFYYNFKGNPAWGMSQVTNSNAAYSDPTMLQRPESGETDVVVRGPNNSLDFYFNFKGNPAWGRSNIRGGGAAFSTPKLLQRTDGESNVAVVGPNNKLDFYFNAKGSAIWGLSPAVSAGNAFNSPSMLQRPDGETNILLPGYNGRLDFYYNARGSGFWGRAGVNI